MGHRLTKIYTRTGDDGSTGLGDGARVSKTHPRVKAFGTVDELNSWLGVIRGCKNVPDDLNELLLDVQHVLFNIGGELSMPNTVLVEERSVDVLETALDALNKDLPPLKDFILPGGGRTASYCHMARTVCRRAERTVWDLAEKEAINPVSGRYLNRLSDYLFVAARVIARSAGHEEVLWDKKRV